MNAHFALVTLSLVTFALVVPSNSFITFSTSGHSAPEPEPEPEPSQTHWKDEAPAPKPPGFTLKFDVPSIKIQIPPIRLPGVALKATIKQPHPPLFFRMFPFNIGLPRIQFGVSAH